MKKWLFLPLFLLIFCSGCAAASQESTSSAVDTSVVTELATKKLEELFANVPAFQIQSTDTALSSSDSEHVVVLFTYTSDQGDGEYGFEYRGNLQDGYQLLQEGGKVSKDMLDS